MSVPLPPTHLPTGTPKPGKPHGAGGRALWATLAGQNNCITGCFLIFLCNTAWSDFVTHVRFWCCFVLLHSVMLLQCHCPLQEERLRRGDDLRLQMALEESRRDTVKVPKKKEVSASSPHRRGQCGSQSHSGCPASKPNPQGRTPSVYPSVMSTSEGRT